MTGPLNGRRASLPAPGYRPVERKQGNEGLVVRFVPEDPREQPVVFDFASWPVSRQLQTAFADAFRARTRVGSRVRALQSAKTLHQVFRTFGTYLGTLDSPPARPNQLTRAHLDGWRLTRNQGSSDPNGLKSLLRHIEGLESDFRDAVNEASPTRNRGALSSYSREGKSADPPDG